MSANVRTRIAPRQRSAVGSALAGRAFQNTRVDDRPPGDIQREKDLLGSLIIGNPALHDVLRRLRPSDFQIQAHQIVYTAIEELANRGEPIEFLTLREELEHTGKLEDVGGIAELSAFGDGAYRLDKSLLGHAARIKADAARRTLALLGNDIQELAFCCNMPLESVLEEVYGRVTHFQETVHRGVVNWHEKFHTVGELPDGGVEFLIDQILPEGILFIGAASAGGKTWIALSMARALTRGEPFISKFSVASPVNVVYLCPESGAKAFKRRCIRLGIDGERFRCQTISDGAPLDLRDPLLFAMIRELKPVIFLDTVIRFMPSEDENSAAATSQGLGRLVFGLLSCGARAVVCLHHRSKEAASRRRDLTLESALRGSSDLGAMADAVIGLQYASAGMTPQYLKESKRLVRLQVSMVKSRDFLPPPDFLVQGFPHIDERGDFAILSESTGQPSAESDRLDAAITANPIASVRELARISGVGRNRIKKLAFNLGWQLEASGWHR